MPVSDPSTVLLTVLFRYDRFGAGKKIREIVTEKISWLTLRRGRWDVTFKSKKRVFIKCLGLSERLGDDRRLE